MVSRAWIGLETPIHVCATRGIRGPGTSATDFIDIEGCRCIFASMAVDTLSRAEQARAERVAEAAKLLSDPIRVQVLDLLRGAEGQVCQCELQPLFSVSQPTM